jgi:uncharacterized coiled-coil protein SlyX
MNLTELQEENERLRRALAEALALREAVTSEYEKTLAEKSHAIASLEHHVKLLLQRISGSRQERIDPDQLLLFTSDELKEIADQSDVQPGEDLLDLDGPAAETSLARASRPVAGSPGTHDLPP